MEYHGFDSSFGLDGKVALITGAAQGIGRSIAELFVSKGADLFLVDMQDELRSVGREIGKSGRKVHTATGDLTKSTDLSRIVDEALEVFGRIDILINNAGVAILDDAENLSESGWEKTIAVNLTAPFFLSQRVGRAMIERESGGKIVNIASQAAIIALDRHAAYCASKAGIVGLTKVLALEWAEYDITVNSISPTVVLTELGKKAWAGEVGEAMKRKIPARRFGHPEEIAAAALYLCSDAANLITGANLVIDGGYTVQ